MGNIYPLPTSTNKSEPLIEALLTSEADNHPPVKATPQQEMEAMRICPKFATCSAALCPIDPNWMTRDVLSRDPTCTWLLEMARSGPTSSYVPAVIRLQVAEALPTILSSQRMGNLRSAMNRAAKLGSKRDAANLPNFRLQA